MPGLKRSVDTGYLIDEHIGGVSGWKLNEAGGKISHNWGAYFKLDKTKNGRALSMSKRIVSQRDTTVTMECRLWLDKRHDGAYLKLGNKKTDAIYMVTSGDNLCYRNFDGNLIVLQEYEPGTWIGIKAVIDLEAKKADIYINGAVKANKIPFSDNGTDYIDIFSAGALTGGIFKIRLAYLKIYKGYLVNETFLSTIEGRSPCDWNLESSGGFAGVRKIKQKGIKFEQTIEENSFFVDNTGALGCTTLSKTFNSVKNGRLISEYKFMIPVGEGKLDGISTELLSDDKSVVKIVTDKGNICYTGPNGSNIPLVNNYKTNLWYTVKIDINLLNEYTTDIYINFIKRNNMPLKLANIANGLNEILFSVTADTKGTVWLDDIKVYRPAAAGTVPAPRPADTGDYEIGIQVCSLWQEGTHAGWDAINKPQFIDRKPIIGWYDENNPEVTDWEIKYASEHGIKFFNYCWYRGSVNMPEKDPKLSFAIHNGYFNARYKEMMKFVIMWENVYERCSGLDDVMNNLVPFWIEYYFKNPDYLKINGVPVMVIFNYSYFLEDLKDADGDGVESTAADMAFALNKIRQACIDEGIGGDKGLVIWTVIHDRANLWPLKDFADAGFDGIYSYTWRNPLEAEWMTDEEADMMQKDNLNYCLNEYKAAKAPASIPTVCMGWSQLPWGEEYARPYRMTPEAFRSLLQWSKDNIMPEFSGTPGSRMMVLGNWNEYGEGHYIFPCEGTGALGEGRKGFGYVDAIKSVFDENKTSHEDLIPSEVDLGPYDCLYPTDWE